MRLGRTGPALPIRDLPAAIDFYRDRLGFTVVQLGPDLARVVRDDAVIDLWLAGDRRWRRFGRVLLRPVWSGAESFLAGTASCRIECDDTDAVHAEMATAGVLHPISRRAVIETDHGTREVNVLDADGNLLVFVDRV